VDFLLPNKTAFTTENQFLAAQTLGGTSSKRLEVLFLFLLEGSAKKKTQNVALHKRPRDPSPIERADLSVSAADL